jgi:DNA-binding CsgD family transcriptional regulator/PAS domain-containing protein
MQELTEAIIEALYVGVLDSSAWERAMLGITDLVNGAAGCLFAFRPSDGAVLRNETYRFDPMLVEQYGRDWASRDPRLPAASGVPVGEPILEVQLMAKRDWQKTDIYNDFLLRIDVPWFFSTWLHKTPDKVVSLSIQGSRRHGPFDAHECARIRPVLPHLRRALEIKDRLEVSRIRADALSKSLDNVTFGVIVLTAQGRVLESNAMADELLGAEDGCRRSRDGTLWLNEPAGKQLQYWILSGTPPANNADGLLHVPRRIASPLSVVVTRLPPLSTSWTGHGHGDAAWMLLLFDPELRLSVSAEMIARDLGISAREAEVAALLMAGHELKAVAAILRISVHTARAHVKSIFARTGLRSQVELIRRVASGPAMIRS